MIILASQFFKNPNLHPKSSPQPQISRLLLQIITIAGAIVITGIGLFTDALSLLSSLLYPLRHLDPKLRFASSEGARNKKMVLWIAAAMREKTNSSSATAVEKGAAAAVVEGG
ncbi:hypothetical protein ACP275_12G031100 [Erythranthe tilingii]